jgi:hypothetical protein
MEEVLAVVREAGRIAAEFTTAEKEKHEEKDKSTEKENRCA